MLEGKRVDGEVFYKLSFEAILINDVVTRPRTADNRMFDKLSVPESGMCATMS